MNKIACEVCMDLIPLVRDGVASEESIKLVEEHIKSCEACKNEYDNFKSIKIEDINDKKIIREIKKNLIFIFIGILLIGSVFGVSLSNNYGMFYNFIIMPILGCIGYLVLSKKWYYVPLWVFVISYIWIFITNIYEGMLSHSTLAITLVSPLYLSFIYAGLSIIGVTITRLLKFAFKKEVE